MTEATSLQRSKKDAAEVGIEDPGVPGLASQSAKSETWKNQAWSQGLKCEDV